MKNCECESGAHFVDEKLRDGAVQKHPYTSVPAVRLVNTLYGGFHVCEDCAITCMAQAQAEELFAAIHVRLDGAEAALCGSREGNFAVIKPEWSTLIASCEPCIKLVPRVTFAGGVFVVITEGVSK